MLINPVRCGACGAEFSAESRFCVRCGAEQKVAGKSAQRSGRAFDLALADIDDSFDALVGEAEQPADAKPENEQPKREYRMHSEDRPNEKRTIIEDGTQFEGRLRSSCAVDVRGRIDGELETPALTVSASGAVHGSVRVGTLRSEGELSGEFDADTVNLAGVVKKSTVIRARTLELSLASQTGKLELTFGEQALATEEVSGSVEAAHEVIPAAGQPTWDPADDQSGRGRRRRRNGAEQTENASAEPRHSEPPPALG
jgi:cytoskeletal protein CcmA (bactofilin family)